jgi:hypothetical protein
LLIPPFRVSLSWDVGRRPLCSGRVLPREEGKHRGANLQRRHEIQVARAELPRGDREAKSAQQAMGDQLYYDATAICVAHGKRVAHWRRQNGTDRLLRLTALDIPPSELVVTKRAFGQQRTWVHKDVVVGLVLWLSIRFRVLTVVALGSISDGASSQQMGPSQPPLPLVSETKRPTNVVPFRGPQTER